MYAFRFQVIENVTAASARISAAFTRMNTAASGFAARINTMPRNIEQLEAEIKQLEAAQRETFDVREVRRYGAEIERVRERIAQMRGESAGGGGFLPNMGGFGKIAAVVGGLSLASFGGSVVETLGKFQKFEAVLTNTLGSNSAAQTALTNIKAFAMTTPFEVDELTGSFVKLANRGFAPTMAEMTKLGDLAASQGKGFDQLTEAMLDASMGEFERLKEFGIKASKEGGRVTIAFKNQQREVANEPNAIRNALLDIAGTAPGVAGSMGAISRTVGGMVSNMSDQWTAFKLTIGETFEPFIVTIIPAITAAMSSLGAWLSANRDTIYTVAQSVAYLGGIVGIAMTSQALWNGVMAVSRVLTIGMTGVTRALNAAFLANPISWVVGLVVGLAAAIIWAWNKFDGFRGFVVGMWAVFKEFGSILYDFVIAPFMSLGKIIAGIFTFDMEMVKSGMMDAMKGVENIVNGDGIGKRLAGAFTKGFSDGVANQTKIDPLGALFKTPGAPTGADASGTSATQTGAGTGAAAAGGIGLNSQLDSSVSGGREGVKHININIRSLIESLTFQTGNGVNEITDIIRREVERTLVTVMNDVNYAH